MNRLSAALLGIAMLLLHGCGDNCGDVVCGPVPPALVISVIDTLSVDTTLVMNQAGTPLSVDTTIVVRRPTTDAIVRLLRVDGGDTTAFETLAIDGAYFMRYTAGGLPAAPFLIVAMRGERGDTVRDVRVREVGGCCSYQVVGRFDIFLPSTLP